MPGSSPSGVRLSDAGPTNDINAISLGVATALARWSTLDHSENTEKYGTMRLRAAAKDIFASKVGHAET